MQKWEYKFIEVYFEAGFGPGWKWKEDGKQLPGAADMITKAKESGDQGWELVSVVNMGSSPWYWFKRAVPEGTPPLLPKA